MLATDFMAFHEASRRNGIILSFGGDLSENVLFSLGEVLKLRMQQGATDASVSKRVFSVFVRAGRRKLIRYSADKLVPPGEAPAGGMVSAGLIVRWGVEDGRFFVACGNEVPGEHVTSCAPGSNHIAGLSGDELKKYYRERLRQPADEGSLGGSIGLIEIARRASARSSTTSRPARRRPLLLLPQGLHLRRATTMDRIQIPATSRSPLVRFRLSRRAPAPARRILPRGCRRLLRPPLQALRGCLEGEATPLTSR